MLERERISYHLGEPPSSPPHQLILNALDGINDTLNEQKVREYLIFISHEKVDIRVMRRQECRSSVPTRVRKLYMVEGVDEHGIWHGKGYSVFYSSTNFVRERFALVWCRGHGLNVIKGAEGLFIPTGTHRTLTKTLTTNYRRVWDL